MNKTNNILLSAKLFTISCIISIILGILFHFIYNFLNKPFIIGLFFPVNESIWEHLKLVLIPITLFGIVYSIIYKKRNYRLNNFWYHTSIAIIISMIIIPLSHYTYFTIFKSVPDFVNILIYIFSIIISFYYIYKNMQKESVDTNNKDKNSAGILVITTLFLLYMIFTIYPPRLELFKDPITNTFGIYLL